MRRGVDVPPELEQTEASELGEAAAQPEVKGVDERQTGHRLFFLASVSHWA
jgi:hypothetical protein